MNKKNLTRLDSGTDATNAVANGMKARLFSKNKQNHLKASIIFQQLVQTSYIFNLNG